MHFWGLLAILEFIGFMLSQVCAGNHLKQLRKSRKEVLIDDEVWLADNIMV